MKPITTLLLCLTTLTASAQPQTRVTITHATVFLSGAELSSEAKVSLPQGESEILFTNVAGNVNQQSLNIGAENGVVVQSATFQNNYLQSGDSLLTPRGKSIKDSVTYLSKEVVKLGDRKAVIDEQLQILKDNHAVGGANTGLSVAELQKLLDVVNTKMAALLTESRTLTTQQQKFIDRMAMLTQQLDEERKKDYQPGGQLLVRFYANTATACNITMSYVVPGAGWTPSYDLRVDNISSKVKLFYKASVYQNSGVKWNNVPLSLSTGNPSENAEAPVLTPWRLAMETPVVYTTRYRTPLVNNSNQLNIGGGRESGTKYIIDGVQLPPGDAPGRNQALEEATMDQHTAVDNAGINTTFDIDLPYTIPSDGQTHTVAIKNYELPATYRYVAVPRMDRDAFLQAQITNWEDLNLLPAATNIFFEGSYVGQGYIDMRNVRDTMNLSLGRDKKLIIRREKDKTFQSQKFIGTNEKQELAYSISIRNTRKEAVKLIVMDQFPISTNSDITIEDQSAPDAETETETGAVKWTLSVPPQQVKNLHISYTVKYPKGKTIANLR